MMRLPIPCSREERKDDGLTVIELLVAMLVLSIFSAMVLNLYVSATKSVAMSSSMNLNTRVAANAMDELTRVIRASGNNAIGGGLTESAVQVATREKLTVYSSVDASIPDLRPSRVEFAINPSSRQLVERRWLAKNGENGLWDFTGTLSLASTRVLPGVYLAPPTTDTNFFFTYFTSDRVTELKTNAGTTGLSEADRLLVGYIRVTVVVRNSDNASSAPVIISNMVALPNLPKKK
jgi:prepilin-type N-terminal cleavage/methylation domain-containing protein